MILADPANWRNGAYNGDGCYKLVQALLITQLNLINLETENPEDNR